MNSLNTSDSATKAPSSRDSWKMFDRIAQRYDLLNHLLSGGIDVLWRKRVARHLPNRHDQHVLDLATGTGDLAIELQKNDPRVRRTLATDMSEEMLRLADKKVRAKGLSDVIAIERVDAADLPYKDNTFDTVTIAFGIRNVPNYKKALAEMYRVLKPGGRAVILEFSTPKQPLKTPYLFYFRNVLPKIGGTISGDHFAYNYLNKTAEVFPAGEEFMALLDNAGFQDAQETRLTFGIATIYQSDKV